MSSTGIVRYRSQFTLWNYHIIYFWVSVVKIIIQDTNYNSMGTTIILKGQFQTTCDQNVFTGLLCMIGSKWSRLKRTVFVNTLIKVRLQINIKPSHWETRLLYCVYINYSAFCDRMKVIYIYRWRRRKNISCLKSSFHLQDSNE